MHESQEAVFYMNGQALDLFGPGRHTLETQNMPLVSRFFNRATNDRTPFHCEVYFINMAEQMSIKWGTDSHVQYLEPTYNFPMKIGASGELTLRVEESQKLLVKLVGTEKILEQSRLTQMFRSFLMAKIKPYLAQTMQNNRFSIFEIDAHMHELSVALHEQLKPDFLDYGLALERFFVTNIVKPDGDRILRNTKIFTSGSMRMFAKPRFVSKLGLSTRRLKLKKWSLNQRRLPRRGSKKAILISRNGLMTWLRELLKTRGVAIFPPLESGLA